MQYEFELNQQLRNSERVSSERMEGMKEEGKDRREKVKAQAKRFESSGNDILGGGVGLDKFSPQIGN